MSCITKEATKGQASGGAWNGESESAANPFRAFHVNLAVKCINDSQPQVGASDADGRMLRDRANSLIEC